MSNAEYRALIFRAFIGYRIEVQYRLNHTRYWYDDMTSWSWTEDNARKKATKLLHRRIQSNTRTLPISVINPESLDL